MNESSSVINMFLLLIKKRNLKKAKINNCKKKKKLHSLRTLRRTFLRDLKMLTTSACVDSARYKPLMLNISSPA